MGTWGAGPFDNDDAGDWVYELEGADDLALVRDALEEAVEAHGYLDQRDGAIAAAAAEVVAAAAGRPNSSLPEEVQAWLDTVSPKPTASDLDLARRALQRVCADKSELAEHWTRAGREDWQAHVNDLLARLDA